jgi:hypothetical protein
MSDNNTTKERYKSIFNYVTKLFIFVYVVMWQHGKKKIGFDRAVQQKVSFHLCYEDNSSEWRPSFRMQNSARLK